MSISLNGDLQAARIASGSNGRQMEWGCGAFSTTDASGTIATKLRTVDHFVAFPIGTPASDEIISLNETVGATTGRFSPASNVINVKRTGASKTSGLQFFFMAWGW